MSSPVVSVSNALNELLDDSNMPNDSVLALPVEVVEVKPKVRSIKTNKGKVVAPVVVAPVIETPPEVAPIIKEELTVDEKMELAWEYVNSQANGLIDFIEKYKALLNAPKSSKESDLPDNLHYRIVSGVKRKCQYIRDNGVSLINKMNNGDKLVGVSCIQKGAKIIKVADYPNLVWVSKNIIKNTDTNEDYPHKDGKFMRIINGEAFNARLMVVIE